LLRVLRFHINDPFYNMAIDEAIAKCIGENLSPPTLRLYGWWPRAVSIGYFQEIREEVNLEFCKENNIEVVRRITGGGAVIHTEGELTYSFIVKNDGNYVPFDIEESYKVICTPIINALKRIGVNARFRPINDIEVEGRKISGSAQTRKYGAILQHGTLLLSFDYSLLSALKIKYEKLADKQLKDITKRVVSLKDLGYDISREEMAEILAEEFKKYFKLEIFYGEINEFERKSAMELINKYKSYEWNYRR